jgi:energy-coupling factor transporter ATP-binding protein EcfA2
VSGDALAASLATGAAAGAAVLELRALTCRYAGSASPALAGVDFHVGAGEIVAVMGHSGAGKSTLLKCLTAVVPGFERAEVAGERFAFGAPLDGTRPGDLAGRIGIVFQDFEAQLFSTNVALEVGFAPQQLGLGGDAIAARTQRALAQVGLAGFAARDPATLSGGEKQRLALAGILALEPQVVLLDEPTTDIDPEGKRVVLALLRSLRDAGVAVVIVEHDILAAESADRLVLLSAGRIQAHGPSVQLLGDPGLLEACGVRPRDLDVLGRRLGLTTRLASVDAAEQSLRARLLPAAVGARSSGDSPRDAPPAAQAGAPALEARDVSFSYTDGVPALDHVSLSIAPGEFVAIIGQNGSGKTTLVKHLNGLLSPQRGSVHLGGVDMRTLRLGEIARMVGFVFQDPDHQLFCATVEEEVAYGPRHLALDPAELEARVGRALDVCGLAGRRGEDPFLLSKGERQRLAVAAVLALEPRVLILDEPTTGLDHREQRTLLALLRELNGAGRTVIVITHSPWLVAEHASRAVLMAKGRILLDGTVQQLFRASDALAAASFVLPEATQLGLRLGLAVRSVAELADHVARAGELP